MKAIVLAAFIQDGRVLMARRAGHKRQFPGHWDFIGGHVDKNEALDDALIREAGEEVGLRPAIFRYFGVFSDDETDANYHLYVVTEWLNGLPRLLGEEHTELAWVQLSEAEYLRPLAHPTIISAVCRARSP
ncbi:MAG: NUDIX domain-containing protein [Rhizobiaceae bacterium]|nr:NUDIX domain-containing protein [Rhizobiaceae bacterium]